jgi:hypothetical protein
MKSAQRSKSAIQRASKAGRATSPVTLHQVQLSARLVLIPALAFAAPAALAQSGAVGSPQLTESAPAISGLSNVLGVSASAPTATIDAPGTLTFELLHGNGARNGYILLHSAVLPDSISITNNGRRLKLNQDFWFDISTSNLFFDQPIRNGEMLSVSYRYLEGAAAQKFAAAASPGLLLNFGQNTQMGLLFGLTSATGAGFNSTLNGLAMNSSFGMGNRSHYNGMAYFSDLKASTNTALNIHPASGSTTPAAALATGADHLIAQSLGLQSGALRLNADFQDVGKKFSGFTALKNSNTGNKTMLDQLTALEGEKGVKRLGFGLGMGMNSKAPTTSGLNLNWSQIQDSKDQISQLGASFSSSLVDFHYGSRDVGAKFAQFAGLREADKTQWQHEQGLRSDNLGLGLRFGAARKGVTPGALNFQEMSFTDKSGELSRDLYNITTPTLGFSVMSRASNHGFKRLGDLSDADKTTLALDIYQQYDPKADAKMVTADDKAQVAKEAGLARDAMRGTVNLGKKGDVAFTEMRVADTPAAAAGTPATTPATTAAATPAMSRDNLNLNLGKLNFALVERRTDAGFKRFGDLTDIEKRYLALDIRRQFDPTVTLDKITPKERDNATAKETGLARSAMLGSLNLGGKNNKRGTLTFGQFDIEDLTPTSGAPTGTSIGPTKPAISRQMLTYSNPTLQASLTRQFVSDAFTRLATLSDVEHAQFANEHGLQREQMNLSWLPGHGFKLDFSHLQIGGDPSSIKAAIANALQASKDPIAARKAAAAGVSTDHLGIETKGLKLALNHGDTGHDFTRSADLALPDADKQRINAERGFDRTDGTLHFDRVKGLVIDSTLYTAQDSLDKLFHDTFKHVVSYTPSKTLAFSFQADSDIATAANKANGIRHDVLTFNDALNKILTLNLSHDDHLTLSNGSTAEHTQHNVVHLEGAKAMAGDSLNYDVQNVTYQAGKYLNTSSLNIHAKPNSLLTLQYSRSDLDRNPDETVKDETGKPVITQSTEGCDLQYQATKQFAVVFGTSDTNTNDNKDANTVSIGLTGQPMKNVTLAAKFDEQHHVVAGNTKDVADFAISNSKPFKLGPLQELTVKAGYASLNDKGKLQNETMTGHASWKLWKNEFLLDYGGLTTAPGKSTTARLYSFVTDPNPKRWIHGSFLYKVRTMVDGKEMLIRRFTTDARLSRRTGFTYTYGTLPEDDKGNIQPLMNTDIALKQILTPKINGLFFYRVNNNMGTKIMTRSLGIGAQGDLTRTSKLELTLSTGAAGFPTRYDRTEQLRLALSQKISAENYFSISTSINTHDGNDALGKPMSNEIRTDLDLNFRF